MRQRRPAEERFGVAVTGTEKKAYRALRERGLSPEVAAGSIGRSRSWAYLYEREIRGEDPRSLKPRKNLSDAATLVMCLDQDERERFFDIADRFESDDLLVSLTELCLFVTRLYVNDFLMPGEVGKEPAEGDVPWPSVLLEEIPVLIERMKAGGDIKEPVSDEEIRKAFRAGALEEAS